MYYYDNSLYLCNKVTIKTTNYYIVANGQVKHQPKKPSLVGECCTGWGMPNN